MDPGDVMEMVNAGTYPITFMQQKTAEFWAQVFPNAKPRTDLALAQDVELGWAIQKGTPQLKAALDDFLKTRNYGTSFGNTVMRRYLQDAKYVKNAQDPAEMRKFQKLAPIFRKHADKYNLDFLLVLAQGYQESGLNQQVKSPVGAVGIMQVMPKTAASAPVKIPDIHTEENNIHAGVRLIHFLVNDYFNQPELDKVNRTLFAIAAYNAGPAKITKCRKLAEEMGYDPQQVVRECRGGDGEVGRPRDDSIRGEHLQILRRLHAGRGATPATQCKTRSEKNPLITAQSDHRVDPYRPHRRRIRRPDRRHKHDSHRCQIRQRLVRLNRPDLAREHRRDHRGQPSPDRRSDGRQFARLPKHHPQNCRSPRSQRHPNPDLLRPLAYHIRHDAVNPRHGQQQRHPR